jgi:glutathione reductase (NADPH)
VPKPVDLLVIGAGSGGVRAARMAGTYGAKVVVVESNRVGGTCVIRGCVPKKLLVYASRFKDQFELSESFGWHVDASFDWPTLVANKDKEVARLEAVYAAAVERPGGTIVHDRAVLTGPHTARLEWSGETIEAKTILLATGGHPHIPDLPGSELAITSDEAFDLPRLPHSILIVGGGYVAVEFATIFAGLGVDTTIVYRGERVLRGFDEDLRRGLDSGLHERCIRRIYETNLTAIRKEGEDYVASFSDEVDAPFGLVMFATGRRANVSGYGLEALGMRMRTETNCVWVDKYSRTSIPSIYAVGDVTGRAQLTPVAIREAAAFAETVYKDNPTAVDHSLIGTAVFAEPEVATIGLTEDEALTHGDIDVYMTTFRPMIETLSPTRTGRMMMKLVTLPSKGKVLGVHILGPGASELIQMVAIAVGMGATKADFDRAFAIHPTSGEELVTFRKPLYIWRNGVKV